MGSESNSSDKLKFREPGYRDTVVRSMPNPAVIGKERTTEENKEHPILEKIKKTLSQSNPAKWEKYGEDLDENAKYPKSYDKWETVYCIDLPKDLLIFRRSQAVNSEYFGAGYSVKFLGQESFFIELRPRSWDPRTLIDPYFRSALDKDKNFKTLAMGAVAKEIFYQVKNISESFQSSTHKETVARMQQLKESLQEKVSASGADLWQKTEPEPEIIFYTGVIDNIKVEVGQSKKFNLMHYRIVFSKDTVATTVDDGVMAKEIFHTIEEKNRNAALEALQDVLDQAGF